MRFVNLLLCIITSGFALSAQPAHDTTLARKLHPDDYYQTISRGQMIDGKWHGRRVDYAKIWVSYKDTALRLDRISYYDHGVLDGPYLEYREYAVSSDSSRLFLRGQYTNGKRTGVWTQHNGIAPGSETCPFPNEGDSVKYDYSSGIVTVYRQGKMDERLREKCNMFTLKEIVYFDSIDVVKEVRVYRLRHYKNLTCIGEPWVMRWAYKPGGKWKFYNEKGELVRKERRHWKKPKHGFY